MQAGLSKSEYFPSKKIKTTSKPRPNFQKEIIMPTIYDIQNIGIILQHNYPPPAKNNVFEKKKERVQKKVQQIIEKKTSKIPLTKPTNIQKLSRPQTAPKRIEGNKFDQNKLNKKNLNENDFCLNFDERINEMGITIKQSSENAKERFSEVFKRMEGLGVNKKYNQLKQEINFYLTEIAAKRSAKKTIVKAGSTKKVQGYLKELERKSRKSSNIRPKSSIENSIKNSENLNNLSNNRSLTSFRLARFSPSTSNLNRKSQNYVQKQKCNQILEAIEQKCEEYEKDQKYQLKTLKKMKVLWNANMEKEQQSSIRSREVVDLQPQTLQVLQQKRKKIRKIKEIDEKYMEQTEKK